MTRAPCHERAAAAPCLRPACYACTMARRFRSPIDWTSCAPSAVRFLHVKGKIVVVSVPFDQNLADNGLADEAYSQAARPRFRAPAALARLGAVGALVRSAGGADYRLPHTGSSDWPAGVTPIPSAALTAEDDLLIQRLAARGPVTMKLTLTPRTLPDVDSHNVIADLPRGRAASARTSGRCRRPASPRSSPSWMAATTSISITPRRTRWTRSSPTPCAGRSRCWRCSRISSRRARSRSCRRRTRSCN